MSLKYWSGGLPVTSPDIATTGLKYWEGGLPYVLASQQLSSQITATSVFANSILLCVKALGANIAGVTSLTLTLTGKGLRSSTIIGVATTNTQLRGTGKLGPITIAGITSTNIVLKGIGKLQLPLGNCIGVALITNAQLKGTGKLISTIAGVTSTTYTLKGIGKLGPITIAGIASTNIVLKGLGKLIPITIIGIASTNTVLKGLGKLTSTLNGRTIIGVFTLAGTGKLRATSLSSCAFSSYLRRFRRHRLIIV